MTCARCRGNMPPSATLTFEKHLRLVSRAASQRLGISRKSWRVFHHRSPRCFQGFVPSVLEYYSAVWCFSADTHLKQLNLVISGARFLTGGVFECDHAHRQSVAVMCMLYKIRCNRCTRFTLLTCRLFCTLLPRAWVKHPTSERWIIWYICHR